METEKEAKKLGTRLPIKENGVEVKFRTWSPDFHMLNHDILHQKKAVVTLLGIPVHLKREDIVKAIIRKFCYSYEIDRDSLNFRSAFVQVTLKDVKLGNIPRIVNLEEKGNLYPVWIKLVNEWEDPDNCHEADRSTFI
ncbi:hypothetical protein FRX31_012138 [Thalictrum thalictroides]|uniref:DUF4283 domain-containing protein n=1 Tax=Thalictrum thalictroides TaxID=46969 RepID=A0A7J6WP96_THATH|nr:hypothetical protein FRX31_012138 [Thalictrum thalictroides]